MSSIELENLVAQLKASAPDLNREASAVRYDFSAMMRNIPLDQELVQEAQVINGVPCISAYGPWSDPERVLLYLHGGAYVFGSALDYLPLAANLAKACGARLYSVDYRLAPEHPHPAAVNDALAAYRGLLEAGYSAQHIAVAGDSAGGGLTISLLLAAREAGLPMPAAATVFSPWTDLALEGNSIQSRAATDYLLDRQGLALMAEHYLAGQSPREALISPIHADLHGLPPLLIQVGSHEILLSDSIRLAERAAEADVETQLQIWPRMFHVWQMFAFALKQSRDALDQAGSFLRERLADRV